MTSSDLPSPTRRLHPAAVGAEALDGLRQLAVPIIAIAFLGGGASRGSLVTVLAYGLAGLVLTLFVAWLSWSRTEWAIQQDAVRLRTGVLRERIVSVPFDRVQAIDTVRGPVQRLFGVVELHVQTAGGGEKGEIVLKAVVPAEAEELRAAVRAGGAEPGAPPAGGQVSADAQTWRLERGPLAVAALTSASIAVLAPVLGGFTQVVDDVFGADDAERFFPSSPAGALMLLGVVLLLAFLLSALGTIVSFAGFTATRDGERLRIRRGVIERREASVPVARVHAVRVIESPLREPFGLAQVRIETAGYAAEQATAQTLLPLVRRADVPAVLERLLPELRPSALDDLVPPPARARRRFVLAPLVVAAVPSAVLVAIFGAPGLVALALPLLAGLYGNARFRAAGHAFDAGRILVRSRGMARVTAIADTRRLQRVGEAATVLQRRAALADLELRVSSGRRVVARHLDAGAAFAAITRLAASAVGR